MFVEVVELKRMFEVEESVRRQDGAPLLRRGVRRVFEVADVLIDEAGGRIEEREQERGEEERGRKRGGEERSEERLVWLGERKR